MELDNHTFANKYKFLITGKEKGEKENRKNQGKRSVKRICRGKSEEKKRKKKRKKKKEWKRKPENKRGKKQKGSVKKGKGLKRKSVKRGRKKRRQIKIVVEKKLYIYTICNLFLFQELELEKKRQSDRFLSFFDKRRKAESEAEKMSSVLNVLPFFCKQGVSLAPVFRRKPLSKEVHEKLLVEIQPVVCFNMIVALFSFILKKNFNSFLMRNYF